MARAHADPDEIKRYARDLKRFSEELQGLLSALNARTQDLGRTWRDQEHRKFAEEMSHTLKAMSRFTAIADDHAAFLVRKAGRIEAYLQQR
ncbi:MAG: WXG100 family type VII secretion target [Phycisphaeraceae bacterium]